MSKQDFSYAYGNSNEKGSIPEEGPSAPPINQINMIPGYEQATFSFGKYSFYFNLLILN